MGWFKKAKKSISKATKNVSKTLGTVAGDVEKGYKGYWKGLEGLYTGNLGKAGEGFNQTIEAFGEGTGLVKREGDKPNLVDPNIPNAPSVEAITGDANDELRKRLGGRFASRTLFGAGGGGMFATGRGIGLGGF